MTTQRASYFKRGFTLMELMVAMAITTIIVTVLISITSIAIDTWNRSRAELRAARQAKAMVDTMAHDFESMVTRTGNDYEWLSANLNELDGDSSRKAATLVFFTAATDRYEGQIGTAKDLGGDVSCVGYKLDWKDPIELNGDFQTFVLNRYLVDPKPTFDTLLGETGGNTSLGSLFETNYGSKFDDVENFICENVFQFTVTFHVEVTSSSGVIENKLVTISPGGTTQEFSIKGSGMEISPADSTVAGGRITSVGISLSVLTDSAINLLRQSPARANDAAWLAKNAYQYSKLIELPGM